MKKSEGFVEDGNSSLLPDKTLNEMIQEGAPKISLEEAAFYEFNQKHGSIVGFVSNGDKVEGVFLEITEGGFIDIAQLFVKNFDEFNSDNLNTSLLYIPLDMATTFITLYFLGTIKENSFIYRNPDSINVRLSIKSEKSKMVVKILKPLHRKDILTPYNHISLVDFNESFGGSVTADNKDRIFNMFNKLVANNM